MSALILAVFLFGAVAAVPIAHALLIAAMAAAATSDRVPLDLLVQQMVAQVQSFPLIAIPFFMLTGALMMGGRLGQAIIGVLSATVGRWHGGPAQVNVLSSTMFGGVSGSAVADAAAIGCPGIDGCAIRCRSRRRRWPRRRRSTSSSRRRSH
jgi:TRAP-type transport system large permease protein